MTRLPTHSLATSLREAASVIAAVMSGRSLADGLLTRIDPQIRPAVQEIVYGALRAWFRWDFVLSRLLTHPLSQADVRALLVAALHRLESRPDAAHTVVDQAVTAAGEIAGGKFRALVNALLRNYLRRRDALAEEVAADPVAHNDHPAWWLKRLQHAWPDDWASIVAAGKQPPPMALRVNQRRVERAEYLHRLAAAGIEAKAQGESGILLARPVGVDRLPGFFDGLVSVQDAGAQRAAELLAPESGSRVLDACAAPGGKTAHLLERSDIDLLALDLKPARCRRVSEGLQRLHLSAEVKVADCTQPALWWDGRPFDAILADVPCTASGVVRRHPDAKLLRREEDIESFAATQLKIFAALWPLLRPGGKLLYATCSVFTEENQRQVRRFLDRESGASLLHEEPLLPTEERDGFYYALLKKHA